MSPQVSDEPDQNTKHKSAARARSAKRHLTARQRRARARRAALPYMMARRAFRDYKAFGMLAPFVKTHQEAKELKRGFYFSGRACRNGHYAPRLTRGRQCAVCAGYKLFPVILKRRPKY